MIEGASTLVDPLALKISAERFLMSTLVIETKRITKLMIK